MSQENIPQWSQVRIYSRDSVPSWYHYILYNIILPFHTQFPELKIWFTTHVCPRDEDTTDTDVGKIPRECLFGNNRMTHSVRLRFERTENSDAFVNKLIADSECWASGVLDFPFLRFAGPRFAQKPSVSRAQLISNALCANCSLILDMVRESNMENNTHEMNAFTRSPSQTILHNLANPHYQYTDNKQSTNVPLFWRLKEIDPKQFYPIANY